MRENETVTGSPAGPVLPIGQVWAAEALPTRAWGEPAVVQAAEKIWDRSHVVRLRLEAGRTVVLKRRDRPDRRGGQAFGVELVALEYLNAMPVPVAPRLLGADTEAGILLLEDLGEGASLADSLLAGGRGRVRADLIAYARALGSLHTWSMGRAGELAELRARHAAGERGHGVAGRHRARHGAVPLGGYCPGHCRRRCVGRDRPAPRDAQRSGLSRAGARRCLPGQRAHRRRDVPDL